MTNLGKYEPVKIKGGERTIKWTSSVNNRLNNAVRAVETYSHLAAGLPNKNTYYLQISISARGFVMCVR